MTDGPCVRCNVWEWCRWTTPPYPPECDADGNGRREQAKRRERELRQREHRDKSREAS